MWIELVGQCAIHDVMLSLPSLSCGNFISIPCPNPLFLISVFWANDDNREIYNSSMRNIAPEWESSLSYFWVTFLTFNRAWMDLRSDHWYHMATDYQPCYKSHKLIIFHLHLPKIPLNELHTVFERYTLNVDHDQHPIVVYLYILPIQSGAWCRPISWKGTSKSGGG
jgi:hypothetical protein